MLAVKSFFNFVFFHLINYSQKMIDERWRVSNHDLKKKKSEQTEQFHSITREKAIRLIHE